MKISDFGKLAIELSDLRISFQSDQWEITLEIENLSNVDLSENNLKLLVREYQKQVRRAFKELEILERTIFVTKTFDYSYFCRLSGLTENEESLDSWQMLTNFASNLSKYNRNFIVELSRNFKPMPAYFTETYLRNQRSEVIAKITQTKINQYQKVAKALANLPESAPVKFWTTDQKNYFENTKACWRSAALRIDYLQVKQLGFLPPDPADFFQDEIQKADFIAFTDLLFAQLQVIIENYTVILRGLRRIKPEYMKGITHEDCSFKNPRELFTLCIKSYTNAQMNMITERGCNNVVTLQNIRKKQIKLGKLYRGTLPEDETNEFCESVLLSDDISWLTIVALLYREIGIKLMLKGHHWKELIKIHKIYAKIVRRPKPDTSSIMWNCGYSVNAETKQPIKFQPLGRDSLTK